MKAKMAWIIVTVERGLPSSISLFKAKRDALAAERRYLKGMNPDYDEVESFVIDLAEFAKKGRITVEA